MLKSARPCSYFDLQYIAYGRVIITSEAREHVSRHKVLGGGLASDAAMLALFARLAPVLTGLLSSGKIVPNKLV